MLFTITTPGVRDHHSDREVSTALFLPANIGSEAGELPRTLQYLRAVDFSTIQENMESSLIINFRAAVQFMQLSMLDTVPFFIKIHTPIAKFFSTASHQTHTENR